jgi:hypothetical protein
MTLEDAAMAIARAWFMSYRFPGIESFDEDLDDYQPNDGSLIRAFGSPDLGDFSLVLRLEDEAEKLFIQITAYARSSDHIKPNFLGNSFPLMDGWTQGFQEVSAEPLANLPDRLDEALTLMLDRDTSMELRFNW